MKRTFFPLFVVPSVILARSTTFFTSEENVTLEAPGKLMRKLVALCDGLQAMGSVVKCLADEWDADTVRDLLSALRSKKVIVDSRELNEEAWKMVKNPAHFFRQVSDADVSGLVRSAREQQTSNEPETMYQATHGAFGALLSKRRSVRSLSGMVDLQSIINMLWSSYGVIESGGDAQFRKTVPSAGALYPLTIHLALMSGAGALQKGIYDVYLGRENGVGFRFVSSDTGRFMRAFLDPVMIEKAHGVIVISGSLRVTSEKYANRSILFVPLEAGHAAQNIHLAATENAVATVEVGGFIDDHLASAIDLSDGYHPLITVVFGKETPENFSEKAHPGPNVRWDIPITTRYQPPFAIASARVSEERSWSHGRDISPRLAWTKAVSEAVEWGACGNVSGKLTYATFRDMKDAIHPRDILAFHPAQYRSKRFPFAPFNEEAKYGWTKGRDESTGSAVQILADLVYFPYFPGAPYYAYANSSGVAAHPNKQKAIETSTLELVERDSFMIAYLARLKLPTVREASLPQSIGTRVKELQKCGFRVWTKDHSLDLAPVACVVAQNEELGYTTCASSSDFDIEHAVDHALMEVEASVLSRFQHGKAKSIRPHHVGMPLDHGRLYDQSQYFHRADFLMRDSGTIAFERIGKNVARSWEELLQRFAQKGWQLITIPLSLAEKYGGNGDLHVIRSIVPGMVPMTFGFRQEPAGMERIYQIAHRFGIRGLAYRTLTKFPHPFA